MADRLLGLRVRIPPEAWIYVSCECCLLSGIGLCDAFRVVMCVTGYDEENLELRSSVFTRAVEL